LYDRARSGGGLLSRRAADRPIAIDDSSDQWPKSDTRYPRPISFGASSGRSTASYLELIWAVIPVANIVYAWDWLKAVFLFIISIRIRIHFGSP
jgi:hypothetical protein